MLSPARASLLRGRLMRCQSSILKFARQFTKEGHWGNVFSKATHPAKAAPKSR